MGRYVTASISKSALRHNLSKIKEAAPTSKILAMVKANAYGHGLVSVAKTLQDVNAFGVASIEEALKIRQAGISTDIVLMEGFFRADELPLIESHNLTIVVHHWPQVLALKERGTSQKPLKVWLKINTGMHRLGFPLYEFQDAYTSLTSLPSVQLIGFMTHFANADEKDNLQTSQQTQALYQLLEGLPGERSLANSAGILAWSQAHSDWVRPGLLLYGASPFAEKTGLDLNLLPVMTLRSEIIALRQLEEGECVGYGSTWKNPKKTGIVGIVAIGYGDGYPWHAKNGTPVLVNGHRVPLVGRVSMDMLAVDLSELNDVKVGDPVVLWGEGLPIEEVARYASTIPYELFCRFTERVTVQVKE